MKKPLAWCPWTWRDPVDARERLERLQEISIFHIKLAILCVCGAIVFYVLAILRTYGVPV